MWPVFPQITACQFGIRHGELPIALSPLISAPGRHPASVCMFLIQPLKMGADNRVPNAGGEQNVGEKAPPRPQRPHFRRLRRGLADSTDDDFSTSAKGPGRPPELRPLDRSAFLLFAFNVKL